MKSGETGTEDEMNKNENMEVEDGCVKVENNIVIVKEEVGKISARVEKKSMRGDNLPRRTNFFCLCYISQIPNFFIQ